MSAAFTSTETPAAGRRFALIGAAGYVAPKHLQAIRETGQTLVAAVDRHDSVGILDRYFPDARFFTEVERFDRYLEKCRRDPERKIDAVSVCSPNYLHDAHIRLALRVQADAICEKPLVINPWNLDQLAELEAESGRRVYTVLQLRLHPSLQALRERVLASGGRHEVELTYVTRRGAWYHTSWKGDESRSGGVAMNIGVHFFDLLHWIFGPAQRTLLHAAGPSRMGGRLELERAGVSWFLSVDADDLPGEVRTQGGFAFRRIVVDGEEIDLSAGFTDLHTAVYRQILDGGGTGIAEARPAIETVYHLRQSRPSSIGPDAHPFLRG